MTEETMQSGAALRLIKKQAELVDRVMILFDDHNSMRLASLSAVNRRHLSNVVRDVVQTAYKLRVNRMYRRAKPARQVNTRQQESSP